MELCSLKYTHSVNSNLTAIEIGIFFPLVPINTPFLPLQMFMLQLL